MAIVSSDLIEETAQADGRRWVEETHTDHLGRQHVVRYLAAVGEDIDQAMAARAVTLLEQLKAAEIAANVAAVLALGSEAHTILDYSTGAENLAALREAYRTTTRTEAVMTGDFLSTLSDAQLRGIFNMTAQQVINLRANKLTPAASLAASIRASAGE